MASKGIETQILFFALAALLVGAMAQSGCTNVLLSMASCLNYVTGSVATPSTSCCSALANVVQTQPQCLCTIVNGGGGSLGVNINQTRALDMPRVCNVDTPPTSRCNVVNGPIMSPMGTPEISPDGSPTPSTSPSIIGSKAVPGAAIGRTTNTNLQLGAIFLVIMASYASSFGYF